MLLTTNGRMSWSKKPFNNLSLAVGNNGDTFVVTHLIIFLYGQ